MSQDPKYRTVAHAVAYECDEEKGEYFLIFRITDEAFRQKIKKKWQEEIELELVEK